MKRAIVVLGLLLIAISLYCWNKTGEKEAILHLFENSENQENLLNILEFSSTADEYFQKTDLLIPEVLKKKEYRRALSLHLVSYAHHRNSKSPSVVDSLAKEIVNLYEANKLNPKEFEILTKMGQVYNDLEMIDKAYECYIKGIQNFVVGYDSQDLLQTTHSRTGYLARLLGDLDSAENHAKIAIDLAKKDNNVAKLGYEYNNLGNVYLDRKNMDKALEYYQKSLRYKIETGDKRRIGGAYNNIALIQYERGDKKGCLENLKLAVSYYEATDNETEALITSYQNICQVYHETGDNKRAIYYGRLAIKKANESKLPISESWSVYTLEEVYRNIGDYKEAYKLSKRHRTIKDSLFKAEMTRNIAEMKAEFNLFEAEKKQELQAIRIKRQHIMIIGAFTIMIGLIIIIYQNIRNSKNQQRSMQVIKKEQQNSEALLANVLPDSIIKEIKTKGEASPRLYENVAVLNIDIVGFTKLADTQDPDKLFSKVNKVFTVFDDIALKHGCQRIKTSGDAYLAVSGMFSHDPDYIQNIFNAAVEILSHMNSDCKDMQFRAGIACGRIVGAVVGTKNFIYDIFGATVNTAFRLQQGAEPGTILIDEKIALAIDRENLELKDIELVIKDKKYQAKWVQLNKN